MNKDMKVTREDIKILARSIKKIREAIAAGELKNADYILGVLEDNLAKSLKVELKEFIGTFGSGQKYEGMCQPIMAESYGMARSIMFDLYGEEWGFMYTREEWEEWGREAKIAWISVERELPTHYQKEVTE